MADPTPAKKEPPSLKDSQPAKAVAVSPQAPVSQGVIGQVQLKNPDQQAKGQEHFYENPEWWLVAATLALVGVTAWLVYFTRNLWGATVTLAQDARSTSDRQTQETLEALKISENAAKAAQASADAARHEFLATHRPLIEIKHVYITSEVWGDKPLEVKLVIVNKGLTPAIIQGMNVDLVILPGDKQLPPRPSYPEPIKVIEHDKATLDSGKNIALPKIVRKDAITHDDNVRIRSTAYRLYCHGFVEYLDVEGRLRKTSFCRIWEPPQGSGAFSESGRFYKHPDPDYEYQD